MNQKFFKYESKNSKKIRLKDLLMLFSIFTLCIITVIVTGSVANKNKKTSADTDILKEDIPISSNENNVSQIESTQTQDDSEVIKIQSDTKLPELKFEKPVDGAIIKPYSPNELIYSETMDDWRTHLGVDVSCPFGTDIVSAERGVVKSVKYDINYGNTVVVESDEYTLTYSSLSSEIAVSEGQALSKGDIIGKSSDTCMSEICDEPHIHFEMTKNGAHVDPLEYIHFN